MWNFLFHRKGKEDLEKIASDIVDELEKNTFILTTMNLANMPPTAKELFPLVINSREHLFNLWSTCIQKLFNQDYTDIDKLEEDINKAVLDFRRQMAVFLTKLDLQ